MNLPDIFTARMKELLKDEYEAFSSGYEAKRTYGLRVNTNKITTEKFEQICPFAVQKIPWIPNGYFYERDEQPARHPYYYAGLYYLQEPSAMTPASRLDISPGDAVLDLCAAPGGKATELGARLRGEGILVANDISSSRIKPLLKNLTLFGISNAFVTNEEPERLAGYFGQFFDKILIDAPCSGEGMFRKDPAMIKSWEQHGPEYYAAIQREIIRWAARMLKPGGKMLYSTCTFSPEENEQIIEGLLKEDRELEVSPMEWYEGFAGGLPAFGGGNERLSECVRIWPHRMEAEGHFMALLKKREDSERSAYIKPQKEPSISKEQQDILDLFLRDVDMVFEPGLLDIRNGNVYYLPRQLAGCSGLRFLRTGLWLGEIKKNRFEPGQSLALALRPEQYKRVVRLLPDDARTVKYLKGETLSLSGLPGTEENGWYLVCVEDYPLGWGKVNNQILKNKYYAGWRWQ